VLSLIHTLYDSLHHAINLFSGCVFISRCYVTASNGGYFPLLWVPELSSCFSYQLFEQQQSSNSLTHQSITSLHWPTFTSFPVYNISAWTAQKTLFLIVVVQLLPWDMFAKPVLSNGSSVFAYFAIVTQQRVYMLHYESLQPWKLQFGPRVEACSNTSTVALRIVGGDKKITHYVGL
jgi:hypothetical protein